MSSISDVRYEETEGFVGQGDAMLLYSDGMVEQHGPGREMYGFPRLREAMATDDAGSALLDRLLDELHAFTGPGIEQEDDITLVTLRRSVGVAEVSGSEWPGVPVTRDYAGAEAIASASSSTYSQSRDAEPSPCTVSGTSSSALVMKRGTSFSGCCLGP